MNYFITGITGFIGSNLASYLLAEGNHVNAIVRNFTDTKSISHPNLHLFVGDLHDTSVLQKAMKGCDQGFHLAAFAKPWAKDPNTFYRINVEGTRNVFESAKKIGVEKVVFTSSAATISPSNGKIPSHESTARKEPYYNEYETTKSEAERIAAAYSKKGLPVVIVNPSRVYGPGPLNASNSITKMIKGYCNGQWRFIPGNGEKIGNYVFIDDVVNGHILAAKKGRAGERYILGGENLSFDDFFSTLEDVTGIHRNMVHLPLFVMFTAAKIMEWQNPVTGIPPAITAPWVRKYLRDWCLSSAKAERELGYSITPFKDGARKTIGWLMESSIDELTKKLLRYNLKIAS
jgi:nucleoside-diphosphate-sugar epimerase